MKNSKITLCDYLAEKVPNSAQEVLIDSGIDFPKPRNSRELAAMLKKYVQTDREIALKNLARIHPDRELIESVDKEIKSADADVQQAAQMFGRTYSSPFNKTPYRKGLPVDVKLNAAGCGCGFDGYYSCDGCKSCKCNDKSNFDGGSAKDNMSLFVAVGVFALLYVILDRKL